MTKRELIAAVATQTSLPQHEVKAVMDAALGVIGDAVGQGEVVMLTNFGRFERKLVTARNGNDPRTGKPIKIDEHWRPVFRPADRLRNAANR